MIMNVMMRKLLLFFMLLAAMAVNAQTKSAVQEVRDYLHECGVFYIATQDGDQPRDEDPLPPPRRHTASPLTREWPP